MTDAAPILHLTSGLGAASAVREVLRRLGRTDEVCVSDDWLDEGPLAGIDDDGALAIRRAWFRKLRADPAQEVPSCDDAEMWRRAGSGGTVVVWHGAHPAERLFMLRACWHLREQGAPLLEVATQPRRAGLPGASLIGVQGPTELVDQWGHRRTVTGVGGRADLWKAHRDEPGEWVRHLAGDTIVRHPLTIYDATILDRCRDGWTRTKLVVAYALGESPATLNLLVWRCRELARAGEVQLRGPLSDIGLPEEMAWRHSGRR